MALFSLFCVCEFLFCFFSTPNDCFVFAQEIIRVMTGRGAEEGRDGAERLSIVAEDMQVPGVEEHVQLLWIELLDVLR